MNKQELIDYLEGRTIIICKENLIEVDENLYHNFLLKNQNYKYYKLHFINQSVEYTYANSFDVVKDIPPANYDYLTNWTKKELQKWVGFIESR